MLDKLEEYVQNKKRANENFIFFFKFHLVYGFLKHNNLRDLWIVKK